MPQVRRCLRHPRDGGEFTFPEQIQGHCTFEQWFRAREEVVRLPGTGYPEGRDHLRDARKDSRLELEGRETWLSGADTEGEELAFLCHLDDLSRVQAAE